MLRELYILATGPLAWIAFGVFILGSAWRLISLLRLMGERDRAVFKGFRPGWAIAGILRWLAPANVTFRHSPVVVSAFLLFHAAFLALALFAPGHAVLLDMNLGLDWPGLAGSWALGLGFACLACILFFGLRRALFPHVRVLTARGDWLALVLAALPVLTGLAAHLQIGPYLPMACIHVLSGEALLVALPFTRLSHAYLFFVSRAVTGSDFGKRGVGAW